MKKEALVEASRMSSESLSTDAIVHRVRAVVGSSFVMEDVNKVRMLPSSGSAEMVSIIFAGLDLLSLFFATFSSSSLGF